MAENRNSRLACSAAVLALATGFAGPALSQPASSPPAGGLLDSVIITASARAALDIGGSVQHIGAKELAVFSYADVNRVLRQAPGVYLQEEDGFGLRPNIGIRGSGTDRNGRIAVMEDGVLIAPAPYAAPAAYYFPRMARMSAVEVTKGAAAINYGPLTVGGALHFTSTPIPEVDAVSGEIELLGGSHGGRRAHANLGGWTAVSPGLEIGGLIEGLHEASDGFKTIDAGGPTGFEITDIVGKLGLRTTNGRHAVELKFQIYDERSDETYLGLTLADFEAAPYRRYNGSHTDVMNVEHETLQLTHRFEITPQVNLTTIAYAHETTRAWYKLNDVRNNANTGWVGISAVVADPTVNSIQMAELVGAAGFTGRAGALRVRNNNRAYKAAGIQSVLTFGVDTGAVAHTLALSARYHEDEEDRFQQDDRYQMVNGRMVLTTAGAPGSQENRLGEARAWSFFVKDTITAGDLILVPGVRYETIDLERTSWALTDPARAGVTQTFKSNLDVWIPGLSATWRIAPAVRLIGGVHRGFANPGPGSNQKAETSWSYEGGVRVGDDGWRAEAIAFWNDYQNLVGTCTASTGGGCNIGDQFDGGQVDVKGLEVSAGRTFGDAASTGFAVPVSLAYTFTQAEFNTSFTSSYGPWGSVTAGDRLPHLPRHQLNFTAGVDGERGRITAAVNWIGKTRAEAGRGTIPADQLIDDHLIVDLSGEFDVTANLSLYATAQNLFDRTYNVAFSPAGARPGAPRLVLAGIRARF